MASVEITAKTLEEAKAMAAEQLGAEAGAIQVTVLEQSKGLFGKTSVRIRAEAGDAPKAAAVAVVERPAEPEAVVEEAPAAKPEAKAPAKRGSKKAAEPKAEAAAAAPAEEAPEAANEPEVVATDEDAARLLEIVQNVIKAADLEVDSKVTKLQGRYANVELDGQDAAYLIGRHGEVINAFQYLVNIMAARKYANGVRVTLDGNHYREKREEALTKLTHRIAAEVKARGEEAVMEALPAFERRIVHKVASEIEGVTTYSEGEEPNRCVVIGPAD